MNADRTGLGAPIEFASMVDLLRQRSVEQPGDRAYVFLSERGDETAVLTFEALYRQACTIAAQLAERARAGDRALLVFPPGLEFMVAFFGCLLAGLIAVPMMVPRRGGNRDASAEIIADCGARLAITSSKLKIARPDVIERFRSAGLDWVTIDLRPDAPADAHAPVAHPGCDDTAFLQYTSGSTSAPKGVVVSHGNLLDNLEMIRLAFGAGRRSNFASWIPLYHDMGLISVALEALYVGAACVLMAPATFMQRPLLWLRAIHRYQAEVTCAPNFAFDLCVSRFRPEQMDGVDLSGWKVALNGAEPVRADTVERFVSTFAPYGFSPAAMYPAYGLAEATLLASGGRRGSGSSTRPVSRDALARNHVAAPARTDDTQVLVGCGRSLAGERIAIVDMKSRRRLVPSAIGEIWINGPNVARGYWQNPVATAQAFEARIDGGGTESWLRTGDLGFLDDAGELYITGRIKDVIIVRGINHYPQDIESTVQNSHPALRHHRGAAFAVSEDDEEKLVVIQEVERMHRHKVDDDIIGCIREAIATEHEIAAHAILLIRPGALPQTTSGKVQRDAAKQLWLQGSFERVGVAAT
jgi:acyl-CoA synthetase (AMP-forming)/AMP-acid ligase II